MGRDSEQLFDWLDSFINRAKFHFFAVHLPIVTNGCLDPVNQSDRYLPRKQEVFKMRSLHSGDK